MNNLLEYGKEPEVKCGLVYDIIYVKNTLPVRKFESNKNVNFKSFLSELRLWIDGTKIKNFNLEKNILNCFFSAIVTDSYFTIILFT